MIVFDFGSNVQELSFTLRLSESRISKVFLSGFVDVPNSAKSQTRSSILLVVFLSESELSFSEPRVAVTTKVVTVPTGSVTSAVSSVDFGSETFLPLASVYERM